MMNKNIAIPQDKVGRVCMKCLKGDIYINHVKIPMGGYESHFDNFQTQIDICDSCKVEHKELFIGNCIDHEYEKEVWSFARSCELAGRELFENRYGYGACAYTMESQDWIDYKLKILPHDKCKEYGRYSHEEISAYQDRFPRCGNVFLKVWGDGSSGTRCSMSASGNTDGSCGRNISNKCYQCEIFKLREDGWGFPIVDVTEEFYAREKERTEEAIKNFKAYLKKLSNREIDPEEIY